MAEKTFKFIHVLYVLLITNILSIIYLLIGLFSLTLVPVIGTNVAMMNLLIEDKIDGYTGITKLFNSLIKENFQKFKKQVFLFGIYSLILLAAVILLKRRGTEAAAALNYFFMYMYTMIVIYLGYFFLYKAIKDNVLSYINGLALMFYKPKNLLLSTLLLIAVILIGVARKEMLAILCIAVFSYMFVKINKTTIEEVNCYL